MMTFALLVAAFLTVVLLPCLFANLLLHLRTTSRQRAITVAGLTPKMA